MGEVDYTNSTVKRDKWMDRWTYRQTEDGQTGANLNAHDYHHGGIKKVRNLEAYFLAWQQLSSAKIVLGLTNGI